MKDIVVIGSSSFAKEAMWLLEEINNLNKEYNILGFVDNKSESNDINGHNIIGDDNWLREYSLNNTICGVIAIGDGKLRRKLVEEFPNVKWINIIHPNAKVSKYNNLGRGNIICAGTVITTNVSIGDFNLFNLNTTVGHDTSIGDYNSFMPGVNISGNVVIENTTYFGTNSCVIPYLKIGKNSIIGAGSVVVKDVKAETVVVGNPAKQLIKDK